MTVAALAGTLEALDSHIAEEKREAEERFESLAGDLVDGIEFDPAEVRHTLDRAGKSNDDLRARVDWVLRRRRDSATAAKLDDAQHGLKEIEDEIEALENAHRTAIAPLQRQRAELEGQVTAGENAAHWLRDTSPKWLKGAITRAAGRIQRLRELMRKEPKRRSSHMVVEGGTARAEYDHDFEARVAEHARFVADAEDAIEVLEPRLAELQALAMTPSPSRDQLNAIDARWPDPEPIVCPRVQGRTF